MPSLLYKVEYRESKDTHDDLDVEIRKKITGGYPTTNIIFEDSLRAVLYQHGGRTWEADLNDKVQLTELLNRFYSYTEPVIEAFERAVDEFQERIPRLAAGLVDLIKQAHTENAQFQTAFGELFTLARESLNPNISRAAVDEMLVQHLLTERLIRRVFDQEDFVRRNIVARKIEDVIDALTGPYFSRAKFLGELDVFYHAIERAAMTKHSFADKQNFLNTVYERFFQGFSVKIADTHGIVYTPQPIVDFMCAAVAEVLETDFGLHLGHPDVYILDPR